MAFERIKSFMERGAVVFSEDNKRFAMLALGVAVGSTWTYMHVERPPQKTITEMEIHFYENLRPGQWDAIKAGQDAGFDLNSIDVISKLDPAFSDVLNEARRERPFSLMPVSSETGELVVSPVPLKDGKSDYTDIGGSSEILRSIRSIASERGTDIDCGMTMGRLGCASAATPGHDLTSAALTGR